MADKIKPIRRSPQLAPLSREHHEGLLAVWKIRQGILKGVPAARISLFVQWFWQAHLQRHFEKEERALIPVLSRPHPLVQRMCAEHEEIKKLVAENRGRGDGETGSAQVLKKLERLAQLLHDHIRFEERQLFGEVEKAASEEQLQLLFEQLKDEKKTAVWEDEFWLSNK